MRVAVITEFFSTPPLPAYGGVDVRTRELAKRLASRADVVVVTTRPPGAPESEQWEGVRVERVGKPRGLVQRGAFAARLQFQAEASRVVRGLAPDVVEGSGFVSYRPARAAAGKLGCRSILTIHEVWQGEWVRNMGFVNGAAGALLERRELSRHTGRFIAVSNFTRDRLAAHIAGSGDRTVVIPNGISLGDVDAVVPAPRTPPFSFLFVGRLVSYKRPDWAIRMVADLRGSGTDCRLQVIGEGPLRSELDALVSHLGLEKHVVFHGRVPSQSDVLALLKQNDVLVQPSLAEGFGIVLVEGLACGLPYLASDIPALREVTSGGAGGTLFPPEDYEAFVAGARELSTAPRADPGALRRQAARFNWDALAEEYHAILDGK